MYRVEALLLLCFCVMRRIFLSDAHLTGLSDPNQAFLVGFLDQCEAAEIYFLGDMFHFWWGRKGFRDPDYAPFLDAIERLRARGIIVRWVRGNHDFHLGPVIEEDLGVEVADSFELEVDGARILLVHGDEADRKLGYRLTRGLVRSRLFAGWMWLLGPRLAKKFGTALAGASRHDTSGQDGVLQAQAQWAEERFLEGVDVVVLGHTHAPGIQDLNGGTLVNLGDFSCSHTFLEIDQELALSKWESGQRHTVEQKSVL